MQVKANQAASRNETLDYPLDGRPDQGVMMEVVPGVHWVRMAIPIPGLDYINLWALEDGDGWTLVDTGLRSREIRETWERIFAERFGGRPVRRIICTHFHPDHLGQAGYLCSRWGVQLWMTLGEWSFGRMLALDSAEQVPDDVIDFYRAHGISEEALANFRGRGFSNFSRAVTEIPRAIRRIFDGERIEIGAHQWRVLVGRGHSPEHACLYCPSLGLLISGDQILPRITPHIGVYPGEPEANPLKLYLDSLPLFQPLPADTVVLPSHGDVFQGLHRRLDQLAHHHDTRLAALDAHCLEPKTALETLPVLFRRQLDERSQFMALGEALAHLHYLVGEGRLQRERSADRLIRYRRKLATDAAA